MNCEKHQILIDDLIDGETDDPGSKPAINLHLFVCPQCADYYRTARREKEIYAAYLSEIEPPDDLWIKFQAKINSEFEAVSPAAETLTARDRKTNFFGFFRLAPAIGFAALIIALGIFLMKYEPRKNEYAVQNEFGNLPPVSENHTNQSPDLSAETGKETKTVFPKSTGIKNKNKISARSADDRTVTKPAVIKAVETSEKPASGDSRKESTNQNQLQLAALEKDTARQIEKAELLLRAFRNARTSGGDSVDDLEYERQQARKLLEKNVQLRQVAENFGNLYAQELLDKIEPFLLDIANLEKENSSEKILDIQERVKNQNIIASLQTY